MLRGVVDRARVLGVFQAGKRGFENSIPILRRFAELGQCKTVNCDEEGTVTPENSCNNGCTFEHGMQTRLSLTLMTVDVAGSKVAATLACIGLVFTVWCACHMTNTCSADYYEGFGRPRRGTPHPFNLCFDQINLIRKHIGIETYFVVLACYLNERMKEEGGADYISAGSPEITGGELQSAVGLCDLPMDSRWQSIQLCTGMLISERVVILNPYLIPWLSRAGITDLTVRGMLILGNTASQVSPPPPPPLTPLTTISHD